MTSAVHDASATTWSTVPKRVLSWWWSMLRIVRAFLSSLDRVAVDVAAVEEDHRPVLDVGRHGRHELGQLEELVLVGHGQLERAHEGDGVLAHRVEHVLHRGERAEGVAVRVLVGGEHELLVLAQHVEDELARRLDPVAGAHRSPASSSISCAIRMPRSEVSS